MISTLFLVLGLICFLVGTAYPGPPTTPRLNLVSLGLAFCVISVLVGGLSAGHPLLGR